LFATYRDIDELLTPCDEIFVLGDVCVGKHLHELQELGFGFLKEGSHGVKR
jgi:hypothetical protein